MADGDAGVGDDLSDQGGNGLDRFDTVVYEEDLAAAGELKFDGGAYHALGKLHDLRVDGKAVARRRFDHRHIAHAEQRHIQGSRDRRCRKREHVHLLL